MEMAPERCATQADASLATLNDPEALSSRAVTAWAEVDPSTFTNLAESALKWALPDDSSLSDLKSARHGSSPPSSFPLFTLFTLGALHPPDSYQRSKEFFLSLIYLPPRLVHPLSLLAALS